MKTSTDNFDLLKENPKLAEEYRYYCIDNGRAYDSDNSLETFLQTEHPELMDVEIRAEIRQEQVEHAKEVLRTNGYYVDNLWTTNDVTDRFECDETEAYGVLDRALQGEWLMEQIHGIIQDIAEEEGMEKKPDEDDD